MIEAINTEKENELAGKTNTSEAIQSEPSKKLDIEKQKPESSVARKPFNIPNAFLLAIIPFLAYGLIYSYQSKYLDYFGVPSRFINYDVGEIIYISILLFTGIYPILMWFNIFYQIASAVKNRKTRFIVLTNIGLIIFMLLYTYTLEETDHIPAAIVLLIIGLLLPGLTFIPPLFWKIKGSYSDKLEQSIQKIFTGTSSTRNLYDEFISLIGLKGFYIVLLYFALFVIFGQFGNMNAFKEKNFWVVNTTPDCIVVYTNSDKVLCKTIDINSKLFEKGYKVYFLSEINGINLNYDSIGPFRIKPTSTPTLVSSPTIAPTPTETPVPTIVATVTAIP